MMIAVTGAFSYSGKYIASRLLKQGERVITLTGHLHRADPFRGAVPRVPLDFDNEPSLIDSLSGVGVLVNTYWIRFDRGANDHVRAVENSRRLLRAAKCAGVRRLVHISITNPSLESPLPYFRGKAAVEGMIRGSGLSYAILRPTVLFGAEDILINNIAFLLRRFPVFGIAGDGGYRLQPVYVDDVAAIAQDAVARTDNYTIDVVGPDAFTFKEMVSLIGDTIGEKRPLVPMPPWLLLRLARLLGGLLGDVLLTLDEVAGLMANLLISYRPPLGTTHLADWLAVNRQSVGQHYASELRRHYS